jgi:hypothetical protein
MGEKFIVGKGEQAGDAAQQHSFAENFLTKEQLSHLGEGMDHSIIQKAVETSEQFHKVLQEAFELINPILTRINQLPADHRKELVASIIDMDGPAYDAVRKNCV